MWKPLIITIPSGWSPSSEISTNSIIVLVYRDDELVYLLSLARKFLSLVILISIRGRINVTRSRGVSDVLDQTWVGVHMERVTRTQVL